MIFKFWLFLLQNDLLYVRYKFFKTWIIMLFNWIEIELKYNFTAQ